MPMPAIRDTLRHPWAVTLDEAAEIQQRLAPLVELLPLPAEGPGAPRLAAGVDVGYTKDGSRAWAVAVLMDRRFSVIETSIIEGVPDLPYTPGYLAFREGRLTLAALEALPAEPELVFVDGHGVVHERGLGLASHMGVLLGLPTIGVPKTPFHSIDHLPDAPRGSRYVLTKEWGAEGASIRLRGGTKPVYVSPGHLVDLDSAIALCLKWSTGRHRVPEPLQAADTASKVARNEG
jgi:deoxyribonuclease V